MIATSGEIRLSLDSERIIRQWDLSKVTERMQRDRARRIYEMHELEEEYRHYLMCLAARPGEELPVSAPVDAYWHTHMLFTDDYHRLQNALFPGKGIRHTPTLSVMEEEALLPQYQSVTLPTLAALFGPTRVTFWPPHHCVCVGGGG